MMHIFRASSIARRREPGNLLFENQESFMRNPYFSLLLVITCWFPGLVSRGQDLNKMLISVRLRNSTLKNAFREIERKSSISFTYRTDDIASYRNLNLQVDKVSLSFLLTELLLGTELTYEQVDATIIIKKKKGPALETASLAAPVQRSFILSYSDTVRGTVIDEKGESLAGVTVIAKELNKTTLTDPNGNFQLIATAAIRFLEFSYVGHSARMLDLEKESAALVILKSGSFNMEEVMVTALGITKQKRKVGYSITELAGEEVQLSREPTFINALAGKVAGMIVQSPPNGPGGSTRVIIRGNTSFGNNQPLYVVDGIPINSTTRENSDDPLKIYGGSDPGDGLVSVNPDDIESITILKGASAAALYGNRAQSGVILVTTKKGKKGQGLGISYNSNTVLEHMIPYDDRDLQYEYGRGDRNRLYNAADNISNGYYYTALSWGARIQGQPFLDIDGITKPYVAQHAKERFDLFFKTGITTTNSIALSGSSDNSTNRLSLSQTGNRSPFPQSSGLERYNVVYRNTSEYGKKLHTDLKLDLSRTKRFGIPLLRSDDRGAFPKYFIRTPNTTDIRLLDKKDNAGNYLYTYINPYIQVEKVKNDQTQDRVIASLNVTYDLSVNLHAQIMAGMDYENIDGLLAVYPNNKSNSTGALNITTQKIEEDNVLGMLNFTKMTGKLTIDARAGAQYRHLGNSYTNLYGVNFVDPTLLNISNTTQSPAITSQAPRKKENSLFAATQIGYEDFLFLELTARNDWSSALSSIRPGTFNNSLLYPSANLSYVFSDMLKGRYPALSYGKIRASWGQVGSDELAHLTDLSYSILPPVNGSSISQINNNTLPPANIKPERTTEVEVGTELKFWKDRVGLDFAWYHKTTRDFLLVSSVSQSSGFASVYENAGSMVNKGIELLLAINPIRKKDFSWEISFNAARNRNKVLSLNSELSQTGVQHYYNIKSKVGYGLGSIFGTPLRRGPDGQFIYKGIDTNNDGVPDAVVHQTGKVTYDAGGRPLLDKNGAVIVDNDVYLGNGNPDWSAGLTNTFTFKRFTFSFLVDGQFGGEIYEDGYKWGSFFGITKNTLIGRDGNYIPRGLFNTGSEASPSWTANKLPFSPYQQYYSGGSLANYADEFSVFKKTFIKFRELSLGYSFSAELLKKAGIRSAVFSIVARNLFYLKKDVPLYDPQSSDSIGNGFGYDSGGLPTSRTYGFNFNLRF